METITLINGEEEVPCEAPVYYAREGNRPSERLVPSHVVVQPMRKAAFDEICYVQLGELRIPVLVSPQADGSLWLGGAYLDTIAAQLRLIPRPLPREMRKKTREWLDAVGGRWQIPQKP